MDSKNWNRRRKKTNLCIVTVLLSHIALIALVMSLAGVVEEISHVSFQFFSAIRRHRKPFISRIRQLFSTKQRAGWWAWYRHGRPSICVVLHTIRLMVRKDSEGKKHGDFIFFFSGSRSVVMVSVENEKSPKTAGVVRAQTYPTLLMLNPLWVQATLCFKILSNMIEP